jgi:hypothetical protein
MMGMRAILLRLFMFNFKIMAIGSNANVKSQRTVNELYI